MASETESAGSPEHFLPGALRALALGSLGLESGLPGFRALHSRTVCEGQERHTLQGVTTRRHTTQMCSLCVCEGGGASAEGTLRR